MTSDGDDKFAKDDNRYSYNHSSGILIAGRMVLNVWRLLRSEVKLNIYTYQNTVFHVLHKRYQAITSPALINMFTKGAALFTHGIDAVVQLGH